MKHGITIEYLKCKADFNFEIDFRVNDAIGTMATKLELILFGKSIVLSITLYVFLIPTNMLMYNSQLISLLLPNYVRLITYSIV